jgi:WD40 repeat protein
VPPPPGGDDEDDEGTPPPPKAGGVQLRPVQWLTGLSGAVTTLAFNATGRNVAAGDNSGTVKVWDRTVAATPVVGTMTVNGVAGSASFHPDSTTLVMTDQSDTATMWNVRPTGVPKRLAAVDVPDGPPELLGFHPDGKALSGTLNDDTATFYKVTDPARPAKATDVAPLNGEGSLAVLSPDRRVFGVAAQGKLVLTDVTVPARPARFATIDVGPEARKAAISADGLTLAVLVRGTGLVLWDLGVRARPTRLGTLPTASADRPRQLVFSPDGRTLATTTSGAETVTLFDVHDRTAPVKAGTLAGHTDDAAVVAFSPDGRTLASGSYDLSTILWDVRNPARPARLATLTGHTQWLRSLAFSPDGHTLATGGMDGAVILWDVANPAAPVRLPAIPVGDSVLELAFRPDGRTLAVGEISMNSYESRISMWNQSGLNNLRADPAKQACAITGRGFTAEEWRRYVPELPYKRSC